jgi:hypothetical protein
MGEKAAYLVALREDRTIYLTLPLCFLKKMLWKDRLGVVLP